MSINYRTTEVGFITPIDVEDDDVLLEQRLKSFQSSITPDYTSAISTASTTLTTAYQAADTTLSTNVPTTLRNAIYFEERSTYGFAQSVTVNGGPQKVNFPTVVSTSFPAGRITVTGNNTFQNTSGGTIVLHIMFSLREMNAGNPSIGTNSIWQSYIQRSGSNYVYGRFKALSGSATDPAGYSSSTIFSLANNETFSVYVNPISGAINPTFGDATAGNYETQSMLLMREI